jgi:hypothetical protein
MKTTFLLGVLLLGAGGLPGHAQDRPASVRDPSTRRLHPTDGWHAARPDAARPDAARPDAARPDAARPDTVPVRSIKRYDRVSTWRDFRGVPLRPFTARFDTAKNYEGILADREQKRQEDQCRTLLERNGAITRQVRQVDSLLRVEAFGVLTEAYRQRQVPVVDSLLIRSSRLEFIRIGIFLRSESGCPVPTFRIENYATLSRLETEGRAVVIGGVMSMVAMRVPVLPPTTNDPRRDAATYLAKIKDLLGLYFEQLRTTFAQYQAYEARQRLPTDPARAAFRRNFCYSILCEVR